MLKCHDHFVKRVGGESVSKIMSLLDKFSKSLFKGENESLNNGLRALNLGLNEQRVLRRRIFQSMNGFWPSEFREEISFGLLPYLPRTSDAQKSCEGCSFSTDKEDLTSNYHFRAILSSCLNEMFPIQIISPPKPFLERMERRMKIGNWKVEVTPIKSSSRPICERSHFSLAANHIGKEEGARHGHFSKTKKNRLGLVNPLKQFEPHFFLILWLARFFNPQPARQEGINSEQPASSNKTEKRDTLLFFSIPIHSAIFKTSYYDLFEIWRHSIFHSIWWRGFFRWWHGETNRIWERLIRDKGEP